MKYRNILKKRILAGLLAGAAACAAAPALAASGVVPNTQLPQGGNFVAGGGTIGDPSNGQMTITQNTQNGVIKWDSFNVGANATVNFEKGESYNGGDRFNTLNYVNQANGMSQIYGAISAAEGNIYIVNPAGVEISNSAQINVGSLYVSNRNLDNVIDGLNPEKDTNPDISKIMGSGVTTDAALMSLGNINASSVTFDGGRVVIDTERLKTGDEKMAAGNIKVNTTDAGSVVIGYDAYDKENETYAGANDGTAIVTVNDVTWTKADGYMWVEDVEQLQKIDTNLGGNYALRNSIDATATQDWNDKKGFKPIGITIDDAGKASVTQNGDKYGFHGKFDGLDYNIFNLNISREGESHVGLFGVVHDAVVNNVTFVGGSITGGNVVGSLAGAVLGDSSVSNITNSASVTGATDVGGIVGYSGDNVDGSSAEQTGTSGSTFTDLINTGTVTGKKQEHIGEGNNVGGLIGYLYNGTLGGTSYNLGSVTGEGHNVGGLVGHAYASKFGDGTNLIYNRLDVTGAYNVGGIVGNMVGTTVQNAENSGNVSATGYINETYSYHTAHDFSGTGNPAVNGIKTELVNIANVGGIAGSASSESSISGALNTGNVNSGTGTENDYTYYTAGNVGGIAGSAVDTDITNATNRENEIRGAHNVGGITGYFSGTGEIKTGTNDGGDILATGARHDGNFVKEWVRGGTTGGEEAIIGNMGGIVGYMDGDNVYITSSANRGTVHSQDILGSSVPLVSQAANAGGIVGKIDRSHTKSLEDLTAENSDVKAAVSNSYNTGDVRGYMAVGGVAGMMYNGEIDGSYNLGTVNTTRNKESFGQGDYFSVNMGGIVGDTTEGTDASALLYDVYNKGQIGDETFNYYARHVGGIVGRLSGTVEKAYNTGAIYNGYNVVGGIAGWMYKGSITNAFNTGNITVVNNENGKDGIQAGGIVGGATTGSVKISNVYNLGTIRGFQESGWGSGLAVGGIVGAFIGDGRQSISNAYTTGNLYISTNGTSTNHGLGSMYGTNGEYTQGITTSKTYYIRPDKDSNLPFVDLVDYGGNNAEEAILFSEKDNIGEYDFDGGITNPLPGSNGANVDEGSAWRIYDGTTPILNAFLPNAEDYFSGESGQNPSLEGIGSIQYGTAYDPLLTIVNAAKGTSNLEFNWQDLKINNDAGLAVYGAGLTLKNFMSTGGSGYFGGLIYSDGALTIKADTAGGNPHSITGDVALGSASQLYGSSVTINADGQVTIYGSVTATGNVQDGTSWDGKQYTETLKNTDGSISITGGSVDIYGQLTSADGQSVKVPGINGMATGWKPGTVSDPHVSMSDIGDRFGYTTQPSDTLTQTPGNISITANDAEDGHVNIYYGNKGEGIVTTGGDLTVTASGDIYMDSDLSIGGNLTLNAGYKEGEDKPAADSEAVLDISNIGKVREDAAHTSNSYLNEFLNNFIGKNSITLAGKETKIAVDMWDGDSFDLNKYDSGMDATLAEKLNQLNINGKTGKGKGYTYIWISTGEQLAGIQKYYKAHKNDEGGTGILSYNFALKNDIDASDVTNYQAIGTGSEYTGTFDGRDNRIIGLNVGKTSETSTASEVANAGIFDTVGAGGTVEDLRVYSGTFDGTTNAGAVAGVNHGTLSNVTAFGNVVQSEGYAGGITGENTGTIDNASAIGTATAANAEDESRTPATAGGIAGINQNGAEIKNSTSNSAVNASKGNAAALGGVAGVNEGALSNVDSLGVTTGVYKVEGEDTLYSNNVGGIAGKNSGTVENAYNESIVSGRDNVGGILGTNTVVEGKDNLVSNVANASSVTGEADANAAEDKDKTSDYVGGLVGNNEGSITNGRNNGEITGNNYVGGLVGANGKDSTLTNLVNDESAAITGDNYVGGIAGSNAGTITAIDQQLVNRGSITGQTYVGGVAGVNTKTGVVANTISSIALHVKTPYSDDGDDSNDPKYFGGVVGQNQGTIQGATNESSVDVAADGASMVGGIIGENTETGKLEGTIANKGVVSGKSDVGGIIGSNKNDNILNNSAGADRLIVSNSGLVKAEDGGAAGIFYKNTGAINNADLVNTGMVIGGSSKDSVTGGLFGKNSGEISNSTLTNNGTVYGGGTVGGLIGENKGKISHSSLINSTDGEVIGIQNVGGLIGVNSGDITGGRTEEDGKDVGYYKYQIYNNGTIKAGTWTWNDENNDGKIDHGETSFEAATEGSGSQNIAGLIGINQKKEDGTGGTITAGYNTGVINADNSTNVGGIAGTNEGTLDQVFNTVITGVNEDGANVYGSITGHTNVGGIAGTNSDTGTISNAYNTTGVTGTAEDAVTGFIAGTNSNTAGDSISNVYSTITGNLVGGTNTTVTNGYNTTTEGNWMKAESYDGFDFNGSKDNAAVWKIYEGSTKPLLKVFLTQLTVNETVVIDGKEVSLNDYLNLVYNGKEQDINIQDLIDKGFIIGPEGMKDADENSFAFNAYKNTSRGPEESNPFGDSDLLYNTDGQKYAGSYDNWLASEQIEAGGGTVNNLGYDIDFGTLSEGNEINIGKAQIQIDLDTINRVYGNAAIQGTKPAEINGKHFGDDKDYGFTISNDDTGTGLTEGMLKDFENLTMDDLGYEFVSDGALGTGESGKVTNNAGDHTWSANFSLGEDTGETSLAHNYELVGASDQGTVQASGTSHVDRANIEISANPEQVYVGTKPQFSGTVISDVLVNGDTIFDGSYQYGTEYPVDTSKPGSLGPVIGIHFGNTYLNDKSPASDWDNVLNGLFKNYNVKFTPGTLTVQDLPEGMPEISDIPSIERHWNFLFDDNPWDRNRDFRERKAEVHFVAGGMTL